MSQETHSTLLHGQLQDALNHEIMKAPAVSGAQNYAASAWLLRLKRSSCWNLVRGNTIAKPATPHLTQHSNCLPHLVIRPAVHAHIMSSLSHTTLTRAMSNATFVAGQVTCTGTASTKKGESGTTQLMSRSQV